MAERVLFKDQESKEHQNDFNMGTEETREQCRMKLVTVTQVRKGSGNGADKSAKHQDLVMKCRKVSWHET